MANPTIAAVVASIPDSATTAFRQAQWYSGGKNEYGDDFEAEAHEYLEDGLRGRNENYQGYREGEGEYEDYYRSNERFFRDRDGNPHYHGPGSEHFDYDEGGGT